MDSLALLPVHIQDTIFSHLDEKDFLNLSEVSKVWYKIIANSPIAMNELTIYYNDKTKFNDISCLFVSERKYRNIVTEPNSRIVKHQEADESRIRDIIQTFANSVTKIETPVDLKDIGILPKLHSLYLSFVKKGSTTTGVIHANGLLQSNMKHLEFLLITHFLDKASLKLYKKFLGQMQNLRQLYSPASVLSKISENPFNLPKLHELMIFAKNDVAYDALDFVLTKLPSLTKLYCSKVYGPGKPTLPVNNTIIKLVVDAEFATCYLSSFVKLEILTLVELNKLALNEIFTNPMQIKHVNFGHMNSDVKTSQRVQMFNHPKIKFACKDCMSEDTKCECYVPLDPHEPDSEDDDSEEGEVELFALAITCYFHDKLRQFLREN